jgi:hypothetical protein
VCQHAVAIFRVYIFRGAETFFTTTFHLTHGGTLFDSTLLLSLTSDKTAHFEMYVKVLKNLEDGN